jgi:hypothetical protein
MPINTSKIATAAQEFMAAMEEAFEDGEIAEVGIVIELHRPDEDAPGSGYRVTTPTYCSNDSRVYQTGLFRWAAGGVEFADDDAVGDDPPPPPAD